MVTLYSSSRQIHVKRLVPCLFLKCNINTTTLHTTLKGLYIVRSLYWNSVPERLWVKQTLKGNGSYTNVYLVPLYDSLILILFFSILIDFPDIIKIIIANGLVGRIQILVFLRARRCRYHKAREAGSTPLTGHVPTSIIWTAWTVLFAFHVKLLCDESHL